MAGSTIVALYDDFANAARAIRALENAGFQHEDLSLVANNAEGRWGDAGTARGASAEPSGDGPEGAETGATVGAVAGAATGLLASLGVLTIPGIGLVLAAGPLLATLTGAGVGAAAGGIVGSLATIGLPERTAHAYAEGVRRGGAIVTASVPADETQRAAEVLERFGPVDLETRAGGWREAGWRGFDPGASPWSAKSIAAERAQWRDTAPSAAGMTVLSEDPAKIEAELRSGTIRRESDTARMMGGPQPTEMSEEPGSVEGLQERKEPLKVHGDKARMPARKEEETGASPGERVNRAMDRAAAGDKPMHADDPDRYGGKDKLAGRK